MTLEVQRRAITTTEQWMMKRQGICKSQEQGVWLARLNWTWEAAAQAGPSGLSSTDPRNTVTARVGETGTQNYCPTTTKRKQRHKVEGK